MAQSRLWRPSPKVWQQGTPCTLFAVSALAAYCNVAGFPDADLRKLRYALDMCKEAHPFDEHLLLEPTILEARVSSCSVSVAQVGHVMRRLLNGKLRERRQRCGSRERK